MGVSAKRLFVSQGLRCGEQNTLCVSLPLLSSPFGPRPPRFCAPELDASPNDSPGWMAPALARRQGQQVWGCPPPRGASLECKQGRQPGQDG